MDDKTYDRLKNHQVRGRKAVLLENVSSSFASIPTGTEVTILSKNNGYEIQGDPCPRCGVQATVTHVAPRRLDLIPEPEDGATQPEEENHAFLIKVKPAQVGMARALLAQARVNLDPRTDQVAPAVADSILQGRNLAGAVEEIRSYLEKRNLSPRPMSHDTGWTLQEERLALELAQGWFEWEDSAAVIAKARWGDDKDDLQWDQVAELYQPIMEQQPAG